MDAITPENIAESDPTLKSLADRAFALLQEFSAFAQTVIAKVLELVKKALLGLAVSEHAHKVPGFHLLTVILGEPVHRGEGRRATPRT